MEQDTLRTEVKAALGVGDLVPLDVGGQKQVFTSDLEGVPCVVKIVDVPGEPFTTEVVERARREVELLSMVESDHVVRVLSEAVEIGDTPDAICWVEELLDGADLRHLTSEYPWDPTQVWRMLRDIGTGLAACHELDVVHRDLSPGNIRRREAGGFVLMDPGLARHLSRAALTGVYQPGTFNYCTPEHVPRGRPTPASDIFSLGILAFEALTGAVPFVYQGDEDRYWHALRHDDAPNVQSVAQNVPGDLAGVVDRCLRRQPARRYLDAPELLAALQEYDGGS